MSSVKKQGYQKVWQKKVPGIDLIATTTDRRGIVVYSKDGNLTLFDHSGKELWQRPAATKLIDLSISNSLEVLGIDNQKYASLYGNEGTALWRKRPFPALIGRISPSGDSLCFVTNDPAVIMTDKSLRTKWAYRNLLKKPTDLAISGLGQTVTFPCANDMGEGIGAIAASGKQYDPFMGLDPVKSVDVSEDGQIVLALDRTGAIFCLNFVKGFGIWKGQIADSFSGVSYASYSGETVIYSHEGLVTKLDSKGVAMWEYRFPTRVIKAIISDDGQAIYYALESGEIGCLAENASVSLNRMDFLEVEADVAVPESLVSFNRVWDIDLPRPSPQDKPAIFTWLGQDGVEYYCLWNGRDKISCLNDVGEEVWENSLTGASVYDVSVSSTADIAVLATSRGIIGYDLSGAEKFKFFGQYSKVHAFQTGTMVLLDNRGQAKFYENASRFSHVVKAAGKVNGICGNSDVAFLIADVSIEVIDAEGQNKVSYNLPGKVSFYKLSAEKNFLIVGTESGDILIFDQELKEKFVYNLQGCIQFVDYHKDEDAVYAALKGSEEIYILQCKSSEYSKNKLMGTAKFGSCHEKGVVVGTEMDQMGLLGSKGEVLAKYTFPGKIHQILSCYRNDCILVLSEEALSYYTTNDKYAMEHSNLNYLEI